MIPPVDPDSMDHRFRFTKIQETANVWTANPAFPMKIPNILLLAALLSVFATPAQANNRNRQAQEQARKEKAEREKKREEGRKVREKIKDYMDDLDTNKDNSLSKEEFLNGEDDKDAGSRKFDEFNKNKDRVLSKSEIQEMLGL